MCAHWASNGYSFHLFLVKPMQSNSSWPDFFILFSLERRELLSVSCKLFKLLFVSVYVHNCSYTNGILPDKIICRLPSLNCELIQAFAWLRTRLSSVFSHFAGSTEMANVYKVFMLQTELCARKTITTTINTTATARQSLRIAKCSMNIQKYIYIKKKMQLLYGGFIMIMHG